MAIDYPQKQCISLLSESQNAAVLRNEETPEDTWSKLNIFNPCLIDLIIFTWKVKEIQSTYQLTGL
jgi:hypothetical protein